MFFHSLHLLNVCVVVGVESVCRGGCRSVCVVVGVEQASLIYALS